MWHSRPIIAIAFLLLTLPLWEGNSTGDEPSRDLAQDFEGIVSGRIVDDKGKPLPKSTVVLHQYTNQRYIVGESDVDGKFVIEYEGTPSQRKRKDIHLWIYSVGFNVHCVSPCLSPKGPRECEITLTPEDVVSFHVDGLNEEEKEVFLEPYNYAIPNGVYQSATPTGLIAPIPDELIHRLRVTLDDQGNADVRGVQSALLDSARAYEKNCVPQVTRLGSRRNAYSLRLEPTGTVEGEVLNFGDIPVGGKAIRVVELDGDGRVTSTSQSTLDKGGKFRFEGMKAGKIKLWLPWEPDLPLQPIHYETLELHADETLFFSLELVDAVRVTGYVRTADTKAPIPQASLWIDEEGKRYLEGNSYHVFTDESGKFTACVVPGSYAVQLVDMTQWKDAENYDYSVESVTFRAKAFDPMVRLDDVLVPPLSIGSGIVTDAEGKPVVGRWIARVTQTYGHITLSGQTNKDGVFTYRYSNGRLPFRDSGSWVIFPEGTKPGSLDARQLPSLNIESNDPLELKIPQ